MALGLLGTAADARLRALDPRTPRSELVALAVHKDAGVKVSVAGRVDCPLASLVSLAHEGDKRVLMALARNPVAPTTVLQMLAASKHAEVARVATTRLHTLAAA